MAAKTTNRIAETNGKHEEQATITAPNLKTVEFIIEGTAPYVQERFANKAEIMMAQQAGSTAKSKKKREAKDFDKLYRDSIHFGPKGQYGIPCTSLRNAMITACKLVGFHMTRAKLAIFVLHDFVSEDGTPLTKLDAPEPKRIDFHVRNASGVIDIRSRPMWEQWKARVCVQFDADQFTTQDVANLLSRAGLQVGIGGGRHDSKSGNGMGWGTFRIANA